MSNISDVDRYIASLASDAELEQKISDDLDTLQLLVTKREDIEYNVLSVRRRIDKLLAERQSRKDKRK